MWGEKEGKKYMKTISIKKGWNPIWVVKKKRRNFGNVTANDNIIKKKSHSIRKLRTISTIWKTTTNQQWKSKYSNTHTPLIYDNVPSNLLSFICSVFFRNLFSVCFFLQWSFFFIHLSTIFQWKPDNRYQRTVEL